MQETIKFSLNANLAIIRKPDSNETYYTYNIPHKIMIMGLLGAIIGLNGYNYESLIRNLKKTEPQLPEFYNKLKELKIGIIPNFEEKGFSKKVQSFNNSVGYASDEEENNLIVAEQILENPSWEVYLLDNETEEYNKIKEYLLNRKCEYIPYIGKNDYFADIKNVEILETEEMNENNKIDSIFDSQIIGESIPQYTNVLAFSNESIKEYAYSEILPQELDIKLGYINYRKFIYTNKKFIIKNNNQIYKVQGKNIYYF